MPKTKEWVHGNKQRLTTGHKTFDRQLMAVSSGQVLSSTQTAYCVRPYNEVVGPVGQAMRPGEGQQYDLRFFPDMPHQVRHYVTEATKTDPLLVHEFFTYRGEQKRVIGYILVRYKAAKPAILAAIPTIRRASSFLVLQAVAPYLVDMEEGDELPFVYLR